MNDDAIVQNFHVVFPSPRKRSGGKRWQQLISRPFATMFHTGGATRRSRPPHAALERPRRHVAAARPVARQASQAVAPPQAQDPQANERLEGEVRRLSQVVKSLEQSIGKLMESGLSAGPVRNVRFGGSSRRKRSGEHEVVLKKLLEDNLALRKGIGQSSDDAAPEAKLSRESGEGPVPQTVSRTA